MRADDTGPRAVSLELLGFVLLGLFLVAIFAGFPIAFTLMFLSLAFGYLALGDLVFYLAVFQTIGMMKEEVLAAVPLFIFMGYLLEEGGLMERLFHALRLLMGPVPGSLYVAVLVTATIFGIAAGTVGATVAVIGIMAAPTMIRAGYSPRLSAGAITAGGSLGILIPPSVMLVVMGPMMGVPVVDLYAASFGPGFSSRGSSSYGRSCAASSTRAWGLRCRPQSGRGRSGASSWSLCSGWFPTPSWPSPRWARSWPAWRHRPRRPV